ncbi:MAG TPA: ribonuclease P protein component [Candidatus Saccharimonadales bacterium]|nr:ribonuclease P protein component [Candidatus Saccharimonadales bacterium]
MLAATNRLRDRRAIARVMQRGRFVSDGPVMAKVAVNHLDYSRAVVVVSKKVSKKAVVRNRLRRRVAAVLADEWATVASGYDIVITVRDNVVATAASELTKPILSTLRRANLIHPSPR